MYIHVCRLKMCSIRSTIIYISLLIFVIINFLPVALFGFISVRFKSIFLHFLHLIRAYSFILFFF